VNQIVAATVGALGCAIATTVPCRADPALLATLQIPAAPQGIAISPSGHLAASFGEKNVLLWRLQSETVARRIELDSARFSVLSMSDDGQLILVADLEGNAAVIDTRTGKKTLEMRFGGKVTQDGVAWVAPTPQAFAHAKRYLAVGADGEPATVFELRSGRRLCTLEGPPGGPAGIAFSRDDRRIVTAGTDGIVRIFDTASGRLMAKNEDFRMEAFSAAFVSDGTQVIVGGGDRIVNAIDVETGRTVHSAPPLEDVVAYVGVSPNDRFVATALMQAYHQKYPAPVVVTERKSGKEVVRWMPPTLVYAAMWMSSGDLLAITGSAQTLQVWQVYRKSRT